jgi:hypothetical protein
MLYFSHMLTAAILYLLEFVNQKGSRRHSAATASTLKPFNSPTHHHASPFPFSFMPVSRFCAGFCANMSHTGQNGLPKTNFAG